MQVSIHREGDVCQIMDPIAGRMLICRTQGQRQSSRLRILPRSTEQRDFEAMPTFPVGIIGNCRKQCVQFGQIFRFRINQRHHEQKILATAGRRRRTVKPVLYFGDIGGVGRDMLQRQNGPNARGVWDPVRRDQRLGYQSRTGLCHSDFFNNDTAQVTVGDLVQH